MRPWHVLALSLFLLCSVYVYAEPVKLSRSGICHDMQSPYYSRTKNFTAFDSLQQCLDSGGRLPKGHPSARSGSQQAAQPPSHEVRQAAVPNLSTEQPVRSVAGYDRSLFDHWIDEDHDCLNTRHELLMKLSTGTIGTGSNRCTVDRGRWIDPYTGKIFYNAGDLDVDHLVPLKWAWDHGASVWSQEQKREFANDEANLFAVEARVNREKGALGPLHWLPPDQSFHCQYILRFTRIVRKYGLVLSNGESEAMLILRKGKCG
jgi:hypothetical protein